LSMNFIRSSSQKNEKKSIFYHDRHLRPPIERKKHRIKQKCFLRF
jgi:hypothetical protein